MTFKNHTEVRLLEPRTSFTFNSTSPVWLVSAGVGGGGCGGDGSDGDGGDGDGK